MLQTLVQSAGLVQVVLTNCLFVDVHYGFTHLLSETMLTLFIVSHMYQRFGL